MTPEFMTPEDCERNMAKCAEGRSDVQCAKEKALESSTWLWRMLLSLGVSAAFGIATASIAFAISTRVGQAEIARDVKYQDQRLQETRQDVTSLRGDIAAIPRQVRDAVREEMGKPVGR